MRTPIRSGPTRVGQGPSVPPVRLHAPTPLGIHGSIVGICDDDLVPETFQALCDPFALGRGFDERILALGRSPRILAKRSRSVRIRISLNSPSAVRIAIWLSPFRRPCQYGPRLASPCGLDRE